jgi:hypothetical protein
MAQIFAVRQFCLRTNKYVVAYFSFASEGELERPAEKGFGRRSPERLSIGLQGENRLVVKYF